MKPVGLAAKKKQPRSSLRQGNLAKIKQEVSFAEQPTWPACTNCIFIKYDVRLRKTPLKGEKSPGFIRKERPYCNRLPSKTFAVYMRSVCKYHQYDLSEVSVDSLVRINDKGLLEEGTRNVLGSVDQLKTPYL